MTQIAQAGAYNRTTPFLPICVIRVICVPFSFRYGLYRFLEKKLLNARMNFHPIIAPSKIAIPVLKARMMLPILLAAGACGAKMFRAVSSIADFWARIFRSSTAFCCAISSKLPG